MTNTSSEKAHEPSWWASYTYATWYPHDTWLQRKDDICGVLDNSLRIPDRSESSISWLNLYSSDELTWEQPYPDGADGRRFWVDFTSCLVPSGKIDEFEHWMREICYRQTQEPVPRPTSISCDISDFEKGNGQISSNLELLDECPVDGVFVTTFEYPYGNNESEKLLVPHFDPINKLKLGWLGHESQWLELGSKCAAFDPTVSEEEPKVLLFREDLMRRYLEENELTLYWLARGDKILGTAGSDLDQLCIFSVYALEAEGPKRKLVCSQAIP